MKCPACLSEMVEKNFDGLKLDVCENGCNGIWFDVYELLNIEKMPEEFDDENKDYFNNLKKKVDKKNHILKCPRCLGNLKEHSYKKYNIKIDECYSCGGIFLDKGELQFIRKNTDRQKNKNFNKILFDNNKSKYERDEVVKNFKEKHYQKLEKERQERLKEIKYQAISQIVFKLINFL